VLDRERQPATGRASLAVLGHPEGTERPGDTLTCLLQSLLFVRRYAVLWAEMPDARFRISLEIQ
jgi:hypothetical protein